MRKATQARKALEKPQILQCSHSFEQRIDIHFEEAYAKKVGYLANCKPTQHQDGNGAEIAALLLYFIQDDGTWFKAIKIFEPYFLVQCEPEVIKEIIFYLNKEFEEELSSVDVVAKEDLNLINHLSGKLGKFIKVSFRNTQDMNVVKTKLAEIVEQNRKQKETQEAYEGWYNPNELAEQVQTSTSQFLSKIVEIREYDVAYHIRTMVDNEIRCAFWYEVELEGSLLKGLTHLKEKLDKADLRILAFDIETTKAPLKFPDSKFDEIMMISYIIDDKGFLITNRTVVGDDVENFEYAPKPEYDVGEFTVFNEPDEKNLLVKFFEHIRETKPFIFTTFNGDFFDWPFIQDRAEKYQLKMEEEIGVFNCPMGEIMGRFSCHLDCLYWVKRDAYLPQGSHGLKAVTKAKLGYDPVELDPELMLPYAKERPQELAEYSVSDAVATYFLYKKMIHDFIFALCTIIPTFPDEVLRRGSGTLCENLLMAQAFRGNIIFPNKQVEKFERFHNSRLIDSDTYTGGTVECLQQGVFRSDIPVKFKLSKEGYQKIIDETDQVMKFAITIEGGAKVEDVTNYEDIKVQIINQLKNLQTQCPILESEPLIYHVDVAAMYPNIILSNRLQPVAIVDEQTCAGCIFNKEENQCKRHLDWQWKGELFPLNSKEFQRVKNQLEYELENSKEANKDKRRKMDTQVFNDKLRQRIKQYCQKNYKTVHLKQTELRTDTVCMRENPFYVDTVRDFRDRRYEFKRLVKVWVGKFKDASKEGDADAIETAKNRMNLYESLQLAHKIILNSFYGYVMKKGARWYSMEMAAMVTHTGGCIITDSRQLFDQIGMPLELDTDGIWTLLPKTFPESFSFTLANGKKIGFDFPCTLCNNLIYEKYGNKQYQTLVNKDRLEYETRHEMSVFFEIDGPYKCMLIPASKEEGKMLKKRYAVFNHAGKMTEVKGFEIKRRGELKIIKIFQEEVFSKFLEGATLQECYDACGEVGERWYDILDSKGCNVDDLELIDYIGEERVLSKGINEYEGKKGTSITCAKRLAEVLGDEILRDDGGINVKFIISKLPINKKVAERAIPTKIFEMDEKIKEKFLRKWLCETNLKSYDIRDILDWDYYKERLGGAIQKIVTIPAALQKCMNPVPKIEYPDWLHKRIKTQENKFKQKDVRQFFQVVDRPAVKEIEDLMTMGVLKSEKAQQILKEQQEAEAARISKEKYSKIEDCPDPADSDNFTEWIKFQKQNWRRLRQKLKQGNSVEVNRKVQKQTTGIGQFMRNMDEVVLKSNWQIISLQQQSQDSGIMRAWVQNEEGNMFNVKIKIPRSIYINSRVESNEADFKKVQKLLPRNRKVLNLYEWETTEEAFQEKFQAIQYNHLLSSNIEGIYGTKMSLKFRAVNELCCIIKPKAQKIPRNEQAFGRVYSLDELENRMQLHQSYMKQGSFEKLYLLHSFQGSRHFFTLSNFLTQQIIICVINPAVTKKQENYNELSAARNNFKNHLDEFEAGDEYADWEIVTHIQFNELKDGLVFLDKQLAEYKTRNINSTIILLQSLMSVEQLAVMGLKSLVTDFPVINTVIMKQDNSFPPLNWQQVALKVQTHKFVALKDWLAQMITLSRYSLVPLGNLEKDCAISIIDSLYARSLSLQKHILWYSSNGVPDLGGHEDQDFRSYFQEELENPELVNKGFYRGYTVEINISDLAINTILQSEFLKEFEEATMTEKQNKGYQNKSKGKAEDNGLTTQFDTDLDEFITCSAAFKKLKDLVTTWYEDYLQNDDSSAYFLLQNFYRWLSSPQSSRLFDPLILKLVHKLMKKNFFQLLLRFKQLGCKVVYANFNQVFVYTDKKTFEEADSHINFVLSQLKTTQLFQYIDLQPVEYYSILLFKDLYNYGGIKESDPDRVVSKWDIALHLPQVTQKKFLYTIGEFILKVDRRNKKIIKKTAAGETMPEEDGSPAKARIMSLTDAVDDIKREPDHDFISKLITDYFSTKVFDMVNDLLYKKSSEEINQNDIESEEEPDENGAYADQYESYSEGEEVEVDPSKPRNVHAEEREKRERARRLAEERKWEFPKRIGSYQQYKNVALEFAKFISIHIFGLDEAFYQESHQLKLNLLRMIRCKEFSEEAQSGIEPSLILVIPDVICEFCQRCTDLDICRNYELNKQSGADDDGENWNCINCENQLNKQQIQARLLDMVNRRLITYQMQDLKCKQCKMVRNSVVGKYCDCTGQYLQTIGFELPEKLRNMNLLNHMTDIRLFMQLMRNFALQHQFQLLQDSTSQILCLLK